ncbi:MAG TPA: glycoside hydrolase family 6 protein [Verrucomicrobiae bacterium]|nr:glycoside hydrolase family 6 protein [Verrucomicrobiae bacterium]
MKQGVNEIKDDTHKIVTAYVDAGSIAVLVPYNFPNRDCGQHSRGGVEGADAYREWTRQLAEGIGPRRAVVVLEPDALTFSQDSKCSDNGKEQIALINAAVGIYKKTSPSAAVYLDIGHSNWLPPDVAARVLAQAGIADARGFSLNVSNFQPLADSIRYGTRILELLEAEHKVSDKGFVIDSSRNGNGPWKGKDEWCNPPGRALGNPPTARTGIAGLDAVLWIKVPGESDGECRGGPPAGEFWPKYAEELALNAKW